MNERLRQFIEFLGLTIRQFERETGVSDGQISKLLRLNTSIQTNTLAKIKDSFPQLSIDWLLTGKGEMILAEENVPTHNEETKIKTLPLIPFDALAGIPSIDNIGVSFAECEQYAIPEFIARGVDFLIRVSGSSMYPKYSNGDILACTIIRNILFFQWGKVYVIDSSQGVLVKRIFKSEKEGYIQLVSDNHDRYPPFDFPTNDIRTLALVAGVIRLE